jgi:NADPH:quinone reductase-like Zn-dependent oxidoreductase
VKRYVVALAVIAMTALGGNVFAQAMQKQYRYVKEGSAQGFVLKLMDAPVQQPGANQVLVKVRATSLNRRDIGIKLGFYPVGGRTSLVPLSDGAGEVAAVGPGVTRFKVGDRVAATFFQNWAAGDPSPEVSASALGAVTDGMLSQFVTLGEQGLVAIPSWMSFEEAASLPCAAVTAWSGLFTRGRLQPGDFVLLQGTGGVAIFGLQFAAAAGAKPVITSSSDAKLERAKKMGAVAGVNYKTMPDWETGVRAATGGHGADQILELGGSGTLAKSLASVAPGGHIALIGGLSGFGGDIPAVALIGRNASVTGITVGSRADFEAMLAFMDQHRIKPVIDRTFEWQDAQAAIDYMDTGSHFGKIVIRVQ